MDSFYRHQRRVPAYSRGARALPDPAHRQRLPDVHRGNEKNRPPAPQRTPAHARAEGPDALERSPYGSTLHSGHGRMQKDTSMNVRQHPLMPRRAEGGEWRVSCYTATGRNMANQRCATPGGFTRDTGDRPPGKSINGVEDWMKTIRITRPAALASHRYR